MIVHHLRHVGSRAFPGPEIAIDFERLPTVIGISGKNGQGKTTLLNLIPGAFYLEFPGRRSGALWRQFKTAGAIELVWESEAGEVYRSEIKVDPELEKTEAFLYPADSTTAIAGPLLKDYQRAIEARLGSLDVFLSNVYATQDGTGAFLRAARSARRTIFAEMLALQRYPVLLEAAKSKAGALVLKLTALRADLTTHETRAAERPALEVKQTETVEKKSAAEARRAVLHAAVLQTLERLTQIREARAALDPLKAEQPRLAQEIVDLTQRITQYETRLTNNRALVSRADAITRAVARDTEIRTTTTRLEALRPEREQLGTQIGELDTRLRRIRSEIDANRSLLTRAEEIRTACKRDEEIGGQVFTLDAEIEQARAAYLATTSERNLIVFDRERAEGRARTLTADVTRYQRQAAVRGGVPCEGQGIYAACQFLADASQAAGTLPQAEEALQRVQSELEALIVPDAPTDGSLALQGRKTALQGERRALTDVVALAAGLDASEARLETYAGQVADAEADRQAKTLRCDALAAELATLPALTAELTTLAADVAAKPILDAAGSRIEELTATLAGLHTDLDGRTRRQAEVTDALSGLPKLEEQAREGQRAANDAEERHRQAGQDVIALERDLGAVGAQMAGAVEAEAAAARVREELGPLAEDLADWTMHMRAWEPSGIPALKMDAAMPELSRLATEFLHECVEYGSFAIKLDTQRDSADGKRQLETLAVFIDRGEGWEDADVLSEGERVWVSEPLSLAFAVYNSTRSGRVIRTLLRDEVTAFLDTDKAPAYVKMLRRAATLGGFRHVLFVSHSPECLALADAQILIDAGTVTIS